MIIQLIPRLLAAIVTLSGAVCGAQAAETVVRLRIEEPTQESTPYFSFMSRKFGNTHVWSSIVPGPTFEQLLNSSTFTVYTKEEVDGIIAAKEKEIGQLRTMYQLLSASHDALAKRIEELEQGQPN